MFPSKTDKARDELHGGRRTLSQRERALLLMADGRRSLSDFSPLFSNRDEAAQAIQALVQRGYLQTPDIAPAAPPTALPVAPANAADTFDGKRSLATTRMFLFDICERMFVRRDPALAQQIRNALREARDRASMLEIAALMLAEVEKSAGAERADSLRERIDRLLPLTEIVH